MTLGVIILNYKTPAMTLDCVRSLAPQVSDWPGARVVIVDNGSGDGSAETIEHEIERAGWTWAKVLTLPKNVGFSAGNNRGLEWVKDARHVLLLNSDTLVHPNCLAHCRAVMDDQPDIGLLSCMLVGRDSKPQVAGRRFTPLRRQVLCSFGLPWRFPRVFGWANPERNELPAQPIDVDWVCGAFMYCRGDLLRKLGGLDEEFFFYGEDYELCYRVHKAGYRVHYDPRVSITHLGGGSSGERTLPSSERLRLEWRGRYLIHRKCHGIVAAGVARALDLMNYAGRAVLYRAMGRRRAESFQQSARILHVLAGRL